MKESKVYSLIEIDYGVRSCLATSQRPNNRPFPAESPKGNIH